VPHWSCFNTSISVYSQPPSLCSAKGGRKYNSNLFATRLKRRWVVSTRHEEMPCFLCTVGLVEFTVGLDRQGKTSFWPGLEPLTVQAWTSQYTEYTIPTTNPVGARSDYTTNLTVIKCPVLQNAENTSNNLETVKLFIRTILNGAV